MSSWPDSASVQRDLALERLRKLTIACFVGATGMVGIFAVLASSSIPGHSTAASSSTGLGPSGAVSQDPNQNQNPFQNQDQAPTQNPFSGFFGGGGSGRPVAVSGGSHP